MKIHMHTIFNVNDSPVVILHAKNTRDGARQYFISRPDYVLLVGADNVPKSNAHGYIPVILTGYSIEQWVRAYAPTAEVIY